MSLIKKCFIWALMLGMILLSPAALAENKINIPILCYHNFNPTVPGWMNLTPERLETQLKWLKDNGFTVIPLKEAAEYLQGKRDAASLPAKPIVITADDGWVSQYHYLYPIVRKYQIPVTLFIYPEVISEGKHFYTWEQLKELQKTGLFDIEAHTYSHPNFRQAKKHMTPEQYQKFVTTELVKSKKILEEKMGKKIAYLAWPFGIYDSYLEQQAADAGYEMAFTIDAVRANRGYKPMAQPRYMILQGLTMKSFINDVGGSAKTKS